MLVKFTVDKDIRLGDRTEAAIKTKGLLGTKILEVTSRGDGQLEGTIPLERTTSPYQLPDALGDLATTISGLNTNQLSDSLRGAGGDVLRHPAGAADRGRGRGAVLRRPSTNATPQLRSLLDQRQQGHHGAGRAQRPDRQPGRQHQRAAGRAAKPKRAHWIRSPATSRRSAEQLKGFIAENRDTLKPALDKLNGVLTILDNRKERLQRSIKLLSQYSMSLGESVSSGPFFKTYVANLLPGQFLQPFVDAAFSDLGLDPNVLLPVGAHRPADRPAGHTGAAGALSRAPARAANRD